MKRLKEIASRASLLNLIRILRGNTETLSDIIAAQNAKINELETTVRPSLQQLEREHSERLTVEVERLSGLSDRGLQHDLERKYGTTGWAKKLISQTMTDRANVRDWNHYLGHGK